MKLTIGRILGVACLYLGLSACASKYGQAEMAGLHFYASTPTAISTMWDDGKKTYFVPKRDLVIDKVVRNGQELVFTKSGTYYVVDGTYTHLQLLMGKETMYATK